MNTGTYYLYEYEQSKRRRNVGFIRISHHYQSCVLQINARSIPAGNGTELELYAFYCDDIDVYGTLIASLPCYGRNISSRIPVTETRFPNGRPLKQIDGFLMRLPGSDLTSFWMASALFFEIHPDRFHLETSQGSTEPAVFTEPETAAIPSDITAAEQKESSESADDTFKGSEEKNEEDAAAALSQEKQEACTVRKISRRSLSELPRRFWALANNSFLLHGYQNYGHLILIEEDGRSWLGVPGTYDLHEARAADLFGFPKFSRSFTSQLDLTEDERNDRADFGYWCRCVGPCPRS